MCPAELRSQQELFVPPKDISFTIQLDRLAYEPGEQIRIYYSVKNVSARAVYVPRTEWTLTCPPQPHVSAWLEDPEGRPFPHGYAGDCSPTNMSVAERMTKEAVLLKPGEVFRDHVSFETRPFMEKMKPGKYRVAAKLTAWRPKDFDAKGTEGLGAVKYPFLSGERSACAIVAITTTEGKSPVSRASNPQSNLSRQ